MIVAQNTHTNAKVVHQLYCNEPSNNYIALKSPYIERVLKTKNNEFPDKYTGNALSVYLENENSEYYCNIYANPAFPILDISAMNDSLYPVPKQPDLYLKQLYGNWTIPSNIHADTKYHHNNGLILSEYRKNWDLGYNIYRYVQGFI